MDSAPQRSAFPLSDRLVIAALLIAAIVPYARTLTFGYVMDDTTVIRSNADLDGWDSLLRVWTHPYGGESSPYFGLYRPLTMALFALLWNAGGHWALWFHLFAIVLHVGATLLVWRLLELGVGRVPALAAGLWFAVHPVHVEAVANIANSSEILVAISTCLLAVCLARATERVTTISRRTAMIAGVLYLAAFLSKESGAVAPILATLSVWGWRQATGDVVAADVRGFVARWWRVVLGWLVVAVIVMLARSLVLGGPVTGEPIAAAGLNELSAAERARAMLALGPTILRLLVWPAGLNPHYGPTTFAVSGVTWLALSTMIAMAVAVTVGGWLAHRGDRRLLVAIAWIVVAFLPASNLLVPTGQILAERTLYVPSIGVALLVGLGLNELWVRARSSSQWRVTRNLTLWLAAAVILVAALRTARWTEVWRSHTTLFAQMISADPVGYRGYWLSGLEARHAGRIDEALALLQRAYSIYPRDLGLTLDYGETLVARGDTALARRVYREGLLIAPNDTGLQRRLRGGGGGPRIAR